jgi:NAD(P)-dependent dehydrogenase (short-subunit alcohol dehydrogenase family)
LHPLNPLNAFSDSDSLRLTEEIKGELGAHLNGLQGLSAHAVKDVLNGFQIAFFSLLNEDPDDVLAVREALFGPLLERTCECLSHPVVERPDVGGYATPVNARIADVLVNNAGYGDTAPFEQVSSERFRALIETNFFGVVSMTRAAIPIMRQQKSGCILQISSVGGRLATPGNASYHAAKWALGGFTEAVALEVASFGVKVCTLEPGGMRTNWGNRAVAGVPNLLPEYEPSVGALVRTLATYWGHETSDPAKVARVILHLATKEQLPTRLLLGSDAVQLCPGCRGQAPVRSQRVARREHFN